MQNFNAAAKGISPEHSRAVFKAARQKTMVEQQQIVPVLKPHGMGESEVDRLAYRAQLHNEHRQAQNPQMRAQQLYRTKLSDIDSKTQDQGRSIRSFNQQAQQCRTQEISL